MSQPQFEGGPPVPLMVEGTIDAQTLRRLFLDLDGAARIIGVREKGSPTTYTKAEPTPADALRRLQSGEARAVQVRYLFAGDEWTDTILAAGPGYRVVRCRHEPSSQRQPSLRTSTDESPTPEPGCSRSRPPPV